MVKIHNLKHFLDIYVEDYLRQQAETELREYINRCAKLKQEIN